MSFVPTVGLWWDLEIHLPAHEFTAQYFANVYAHVVEPESGRQRTQPLGVESDAEEGTERHIAGDPTERIQNGGAHDGKLKGVGDELGTISSGTTPRCRY
jgi:hypothetical protein